MPKYNHTSHPSTHPAASLRGIFARAATVHIRLVACVLVFLSAPFFPALAAQESENSRIAALQEKAGQGDPVAQYNLGRAYASGEGGLPQDPAEAQKWLRKSAAQGNIYARRGLDAMTVSKGHPGVFKFKTDDGVYQFTIDTRQCPPELDAWAREKMVPVLKEWYPKMVQFLPSKGYNAPRDVSITFDKNYNPRGAVHGAETQGNRIICYVPNFLVALGSVIVTSNDATIVHELTHVVQGVGGRNWENVPSWLTEGMADYVKYLYEPYADWVNPTSQKLMRYNGSYKVSAQFLRWVAEAYDKDIVPKLAVVCRQGNYSDKVWKQYTGHTIQELNEEWKSFVKHPENRAILKYNDEDLRAPFLQQGKASPEKAK